MLENPSKISISKDRTALIIILSSLLFRMVAASLSGPGFDEAYYHLFAKYFAPGYFDHPPLIAISAGLGYWITNIWNSLSLRLGAIISFTIALLGFYHLAYRLYGRKAAILAIVIPHATPFFTIGAGAFVLPDNTLVASWIWFLYVIQRLREESINKSIGFAILGVLAGLSLLAKYHAVLLPASLVISSLFDPKIRKWWSDWRLYIALVTGVLTFSPCLIWNYNNEWISFVEQFGKAGSGEFRLRFDLLGQAIGGQLGYMTPWVCIAVWITAFKKVKSRDDVWLLPFFLLPVIAISMIGLTRGILPHWTMPGYIAAIVMAAGTLKWDLKDTKIKAAIIVNALLITIVVVQAQTGFMPLKAKSDPTLDPLGWKPVLKYLEEEGHLKSDDVVFAHKWFTAGELSWADQGEHDIVLLGNRPHMFAWWAPEIDYSGRSGVIISQKRYNISSDNLLKTRFEDVENISMPIMRDGYRDVQMVVWRVTNLKNPVAPPYGPFVEN
jgi:Dolichyl-phosphate-mannose-protein mannosyltransferase